MSMIQIARNNRLAALASMEARKLRVNRTMGGQPRLAARAMPSFVFRHREYFAQSVSV